MRPISSGTRLAGIVLAVLLVPFVARLLWEMTYLTWRDGEQMLGFAMMHLFPALVLLEYALYLAGITWVLVVGIAFLARKRSLRTVDRILVVALVTLCLLPMLPYRTYERLSHAIWGPSPITRRGAVPVEQAPR